MDASDDSPPPYMIRAAELYPKESLEKEDDQLTVPYQELAGEAVKYLGRTDDGVLALSNYRIFLQRRSTREEISIPLGLIESLQSRDLFHLIVYCKDASTIKCSFETAEQCSEWLRRLQLSIGVPEVLESIFAFPFCSWACDMLAGIGQNNTSSNQNGGHHHHQQMAATTSSSSCFVNGSCSWLPPSTFNYSSMGGGECSERFQRAASRYEDDFLAEVKRLGFDLNGPWRISQANIDFKLCASYPPKILVPCCISDDTLSNVANFRGSRRLPAVVWRHRRSGAVIARCSQPEVGWLGWRNTKDEQLLKALADACAFDRGEQLRLMSSLAIVPQQQQQLQQQQLQQQVNPVVSMNNEQNSSSTVATNDGNSLPSSSPECSHEEVTLDEVRKILIVDARSYTSAVTNRARGGGCECIEYYPCAEIEFMNLSNIHAIRKSFHALRQLCASPPDVPNWLGLLEKTMWLQHLSGLLAASMTVCHAIDKKGRPVLVHCSDGWDRTPQIVATAQLCLDPFYRTVDGFRILVEREWLSYGHKFADRCGHGPDSDELNERCPIFLQWLDLVHQIHRQFSCSFEFSMAYLIKLAQHSHSGLFGTFLCNTLKERIENSVFERTFSVWPFLSGPMYRNPLYVPNKDKVLWPAYNVRDLSLWTEVYLGSLGGNQHAINLNAHIQCETLINSNGGTMPKTRSYGDLINAGVINSNGISRRSSDPNMLAEPNLTDASQFDNKSINNHLECDDDCIDSPNLLTNFIYDATKQLANLTQELNNQEEETEVKVRREESESESEMELEQQITTIHGPKMNGMLHNSSNPSITLKLEDEHHHKDNSSLEEEQFNGSMDSEKSHSPNHQINGVNGDNAGVISPPPSIDPTPSNWYGSVTNSTDTLVPVVQSLRMEETTKQISNTTFPVKYSNAKELSNNNGAENGLVEDKLLLSPDLQTDIPEIHTNGRTRSISIELTTNNNNNNNNIGILSNSNGLIERVQQLEIEDATENHINNVNGTNLNNEADKDDNDDDEQRTNSPPVVSNIEESILILPEHEKLEISSNGQYDEPSSSSSMDMVVSTSSQTTSPFLSKSAVKMQRHRRTLSSNSRVREGGGGGGGGALLFSHAAALPNRAHNFMTRFSLPTTGQNGGGGGRVGVVGGNIYGEEGVRSLPMTPPGQLERAAIAISCPDGLAHALSEENIRLQQIVHEHKLREDVLLREIHDMRVALLKKICPSCNNESMFINSNHHNNNNNNINDDQCSILDNVENASISSWEAVEDRSVSGPSSSTCTNSSSILQPLSNNAQSVLWVPDHAVSRCTSCQTEFWLGRRKHHCRSCGQIFCAECSEFWAPLPDERLFNPVRLCGPCYHAVTTRIHQQQQQQQQQLQQQQNITPSIHRNSNIFFNGGSPSPSPNHHVPGLMMPSYPSHRNLVTGCIPSSQRLPQHQQQNQCATASMKVNASTSPTAAATATN